MQPCVLIHSLIVMAHVSLILQMIAVIIFYFLITLGEGWHNNHHFYAGSVRQGFYWWQIDITFYLLKLMSLFGLVWGLKPVPDKVYQYKKIKTYR